jgi:hypothetical protein
VKGTAGAGLAEFSAEAVGERPQGAGGKAKSPGKSGAFLRAGALAYGTVLGPQLPPRGLEANDASAIQDKDLRQGRRESAAQSGAAGSGTGSHGAATDPDLRRVIDAWPGLPAEVKARVLAEVLLDGLPG